MNSMRRENGSILVVYYFVEEEGENWKRGRRKARRERERQGRERVCEIKEK
jgi:hypothetical protein